MKKIFSCIIFLCATFSFSQTKDFKVSGTIISEIDNMPLESATVYLERVKDSSLITYTISDKKGSFTLEEKSADKKANLYVSYVGYQTYYKQVDLNTSGINLGQLNLIASNSLDEVVIKSTAPITIKKDTLEFHVNSFKTKKDATVEDLLKQLPGVEVEEDGSIKVNGKPVNKILVNGKPFFGDDPTITTKNLTKDLIEKIQIVDTKTKAQAYAGEDGDDENKTINLTIKEENNKGIFGRVSAGAGTQKTYEFAGMLNRFNNDQRVSVLVGGNNTNSPGFSFGEIRKMFGGGNSMSFNSNGSFAIDGRSFGGGKGITTSKNIGVNYADELSDKVDISSDYFYSASSSDDKTTTERENFLPDGSYFTNAISNSQNDNYNHSANIDFDVELDSTLLVNIKPSFRYSKSETRYNRSEESLDSDNTLTNQSNAASFVSSYGNNFSNKIDVTKKIGSNGAYLKFEIINKFNVNNTDDFLTSETNIYGENPEDITRDQFTEGENKLNSFAAEIAYRLPIIPKELFINFEYDFKRDKRNDLKSTFDRDLISDNFTSFNTELSTDFEYVDQESSPGISLNLKKEKLSARINSNYVFRSLRNSDFLRPSLSLKRKFQAVELSSYMRYRFSPKATFYMNYRMRNSSPRIQQLQPFQNVSNPLNTITGNPNLDPTTTHSLYSNYNAFDFQKGTGFYFNLSAVFNENQIVSKSTINEDYVRETTYANVSGGKRLRGGFSFSKKKKIDSLRSLKYSVGAYGNYNKNINFNNEVQYASNVASVSPRITITYTVKDILEIRPRYSVSFTKNKYDIEAFEDREFLYHSLDIETATFLPKNLEWRNNIKYNYNPNIAAGFQKSAWFWNSTLAYSVLKDQGVVTLKAYDVLGQNTNARRTATEDYIQDAQSTVLEQYFMLSFSWKFNSLGKKGESGNDDMFYLD
ncbi:outer membrane beta-barrel protein [Lacinutrix sp. WUR7]|uniref:outer membrane beta-barrel protein n=1 Tax=Lacinutrix sp. WUR7 TaxID=2653681 RepID=UPI00193D4E78|nr:outer membrane beta-barrel protein [Lacinutrix sp. WUR7]QRM89374.1 outer membrane beta-barrel protein [Lacinutrix sp. WUR7]